LVIFLSPSLCVQGYLRAAKCHLMLGNPNLSIDFYRKVLSVQPRHKQAKEELEVSQRALLHLERANLETERGEHRTAVYYLDRCLEAAPNCVQFQTMKAESLALSKRYDDAHYIAKCVPQVSSVMCITLL